MKISLINHGTASEWGGGDSVQIRETYKRLRERGYEVDIQNSDEPDIKDADIVHIFNCRVYNSFAQQFRICKKYKKPIVVSPIWISLDRALWGSRGTFAVLQKGNKEGEDAIRKELSLLRERELSVEIEGSLVQANGSGSKNKKWIKEIGRMLNEVDGVVVNSWLELKAIQTDLNWTGNNYGVGYYGVDISKFMNSDPNKFRAISGIKGDFIMQAGRIEPGKNQAMLCWALRQLDIPIVLIGSSKHWPAYGQLCKEIGGNKVHIIDHLPAELLASAYSAARVHCLPSWMDTCGLVSLEAAVNRTAIVGSTFGHELEYLQSDAYLVDPADPEGIKKGVIGAWEDDKKSIKQTRLKERILEKYNWEKCADETIDVYNKVIGTA